MSVRQRYVRGGVVAACALALFTALAPEARAVGLPFVDLPDTEQIVDDASGALVDMIASGVGTLTNEIIKASDTVGSPQVGTANTWFSDAYKRTVGVSLWLMAIAALVAVASAGIRGRVGEMVGVILVNVPGAVIAMMLVTVGVQLSLGLVDAMTAYTFRGSIDDIQAFLHAIGTTFMSRDGVDGAAGAQLAPGLSLIIGLFVIVAQLVILAVLVIRSALIYIVTLFLPLVLAVQVWPASRHMTRKALELLAVLVFSKFAIFTCFALGAGAATDVLGTPPTPTNRTAAPIVQASGGDRAADEAGEAPPPVQSAIVGFGVMAAAAFSPLLLMSIIPGIAGSFGAGLPGGAARGGVAGVKSPVQLMRSTLGSMNTVRRPGGGSSSGSRSGSGSTGGARQGINRATQRGSQGPGGQEPPSGRPPSTGSASAGAESHHGPTPPARSTSSTGSTRRSDGSGNSLETPASASRPASSSAASPAPPPVSAAPPGPSQGPGAADGTSPDPATAEHGSGSASRTQVSAQPSPRPSMPVTPAAAATVDGFARISTRQSSNLETM